jgi:hypothetical protein
VIKRIGEEEFDRIEKKAIFTHKWSTNELMELVDKLNQMFKEEK